MGMGTKRFRCRGVDNQIFRLDRRLLLGHELAEFTFPNLNMRSLDRSQSAQDFFTSCLLETLRVAFSSPNKEVGHAEFHFWFIHFQFIRFQTNAILFPVYPLIFLLGLKNGENATWKAGFGLIPSMAPTRLSKLEIVCWPSDTDKAPYVARVEKIEADNRSNVKFIRFQTNAIPFPVYPLISLFGLKNGENAIWKAGFRLLYHQWHQQGCQSWRLCVDEAIRPR